MNYKLKQNLFFIFIYAIAMGFLEAIIVVYLRTIYYPAGFYFPIVIMSQKLLSAELLREICTLIMLFAIAFIAGQNKMQRLSYFLFSFAIWDIFYYIGLKILLDWPPSLLTWDILFLLPITWLGPVLAPIICSISMIILSLTILFIQNAKKNFKLQIFEWGFIITGALLTFITFIWEYAKILITNNLVTRIFSLLENDQFRHIISIYVPYYFNWPIFAIGIVFIYISILCISRRYFFSTYTIMQ